MKYSLDNVQSGAADCEKGFVKCFLKLLAWAAWQLQCSIAQRPVELSEIMSQNLFHNLPPQTVLPRQFNNLHG